MNERNAFTNDRAAMNGESQGALAACGLWLRLGFVGGSIGVAGVAALFGGDVTPVSALAMAIGGAALAVFGWRRAYAAIDDTERAETRVAGVPSSDISTVGGA